LSYDQSRVIKAMAMTTALSMLMLLITVRNLRPFVMELVVLLEVMYSTTKKWIVARRVLSGLTNGRAFLQVSA
jgi:hypothetical protein